MIKWSKEKIIEQIQKLKYKNAKYAKVNYYALYGAAIRYFGSWASAIKEAGFNYDDIVQCKKRTREEILNNILALKDKRCKINQKENGYLYSYVIRIFGSWKKAIEAAGLNYKNICSHEKWSKERILNEICLMEYKSASYAFKYHGKLLNAAIKYFGSWRLAVEFAGYNYDNIRRHHFCEHEVEEILKGIFITVHTQKTFKWLKYKRKLFVDFYMDNIKVAIEYNGEQHYRVIDFSGKNPEKAKLEFKTIKARDRTKRRLLKKHGIKLIEIKYTENINEENIRRILLENGVSL